MMPTFETLYGAVRALNSLRGYHERSCLNALGATVQFWHETGGFRSDLMLGNWNLAGIICTRSWMESGGKCFSAKTWEHEEDRDVNRVRGFRSYPSLPAFLADYSRIIKRYYPVSSENPDCVWGYLAGLQNGKGGRKWATDPLYLEKLFTFVRNLAPKVLGPNTETLLESSRRAFHERGLEKLLPAEIR